MKTKKTLSAVILFGISLLLGTQALATEPEECPPCQAWDEVALECVWNCLTNQSCCDGSCCDEPCCNGDCCSGDCISCVDDECQYCGGDSSLHCCDGITCYDPQADHCCDYGTGKICAKTESCCEGTQGEDCCDNLTESCCEGVCFEFDDYMCCGGQVCRQPCCDDWECTKCVDGNCVECLEKANTYQELTGCSGVIVDDPDWEAQPNGCSSPLPPADNPAGYVCGEASSFLAACNDHDRCYQRCGSDKISECDSRFDTALQAVCSPFSGECREVCFEKANRNRSQILAD